MVTEEQDELGKEVMARYGRAMYKAQVLEHEIVNLFVVARIRREYSGTPVDTDKMWDDEFRKTLGAVVKQLKACLDIPDLHVRLETAVRCRNRLVHRFFREHAASLLSVPGKKQMIEELNKMSDYFQELDALLTPRTLSILRKLGATDELIDATWREVLAEEEMYTSE